MRDCESYGCLRVMHTPGEPDGAGEARMSHV